MGAGCGVALGTAALFSYAAPWLGLSVVCLYFARRRPSSTSPPAWAHCCQCWRPSSPASAGSTACSSPAPTTPPGSSRPLRPVVGRDQPGSAAVGGGPPARPQRRRMRNTPGWPFLVGAGVAVAFSVLAGLARGGAEAAWLPFFPWLTVAAVAPAAQGGPSPAARSCSSPSARHRRPHRSHPRAPPGDAGAHRARLHANRTCTPDQSSTADQASSTSSSRSSDQASSTPSGSRIARSGLSAMTAPGSWVTSTIAPG